MPHKTEEWVYPGDKRLAQTGHIHGVPATGPAQLDRGDYTRWSQTTDSFEAVRDYYRQLCGIRTGAGSGPNKDGDAYVVDGSPPLHKRPVNLSIITRRYGRVTMSALVSRGQEEQVTYITLIHRQMSD
jgi:hypothetical protein